MVVVTVYLFIFWTSLDLRNSFNFTIGFWKGGFPKKDYQSDQLKKVCSRLTDKNEEFNDVFYLLFSFDDLVTYMT